MKKRVHILILFQISIFFLFCTYSQVGINISSPQGLLHIDPSNDTPVSAINSDDIVVDNDGNVGIGTAPNTKLHIKSAIPSKGLRIIDGNQGADRTLMSDLYGGASWQFPDAIPIKKGVFSVSGVNIPLNTSAFINTNAYIDLPPGMWCVKVSIQATFSSPSLGRQAWIRSRFVPTGDEVNSTSISGIIMNNYSSAIVGFIILNNTTPDIQRYQYEAGNIYYTGSDASSIYVNNYAIDNATNSITAMLIK